MAYAPINFADLITFTRSGSGGYFNSSGVWTLAGNNVPRFNHRFNSTSWEPAGLLIEPAATNLLLRSREFDDASWNKTGLTGVTADAAIAPDGTNTADKLVVNGTTGSHQITQTVTATATAHTFSVCLKAAEYSIACLALPDSGGTIRNTWFNLATGAVGTTGTGVTPTIIPVGNGWYRCAVSIGAAFAGSNTARIYLSTADGTSTHTGDGTSGLLVWGAQYEAGSVATSYILTEGSTAARAADVALISGSNFSSWFNPTQMTFVAEYDVNGYVANQRLFEASNSTHFIAWYSQGNEQRLRVTTGVGTQVATGAAFPAAGVTQKAALGFQDNNNAISINGAAAVSAPAILLPVGIDQLNIGSTRAGGSNFNGHIRSLHYYPVRLSNAQLVALSTL